MGYDDAPLNSGLHPTRGTTALIFARRLGAAGDAGREALSRWAGVMQIEYLLTLEDIVAFNWHHARTSASWRHRYRSNLAWVLVAALVVVMLWPGWSMWGRALYFIGFSLFCLLTYPSYYRWLVNRNTRTLNSEGRNTGVLGHHIVAIGPDGITEISDAGESRTAWGGVGKVEENDEYVFLYTGSFMAHVIPKRAFIGGDEASAFFNQARAYLLVARA